MIPTVKDQGAGLIPWSPLAMGSLARIGDQVNTERGKLTSGMSKAFGISDEEVDEEIKRRVKKIADDKGVNMAQIALAWVLSKPYVSAPIVGVTKQLHLDDAIAALKVQLTEEEIKSLEEPYRPKKPNAGFQ